MSSSAYLLAGQLSELERLQLQSRVWEPSGRRLLEEIDGHGARVVDIGCGVMGWLRLLSPGGTVVLEDPDWGSWHFNPPAKACEELIVLICEAFARWGDAEAGRKHLELLRSFGIEGNGPRSWRCRRHTPICVCHSNS